MILVIVAKISVKSDWYDVINTTCYDFEWYSEKYSIGDY